MEPFLSIPIYLLLFLTLYFEVFLLTTYFEEKERFAYAPPRLRLQERYPTVTIIVPVWNEEKTLAGTIISLLALDYPKDRLNICIVDDGSMDRTLEIAQTFSSNLQVKIFTKENGGKYTAVNLGLRHAASELIGCLDADSYVAPDALKAIIPYFDDIEVMAVTPSVQVHKPNTVISRIQSAEYMVGAFTRKIFSRLNGLYVVPGPFSIYRRSVFAEIGDFVHGYGTEDMEMALRMQSHHMKIENAHTALVYTVCPQTVRALYTQRVRWVSGFLKNIFFQYRHTLLNKTYGDLGLLTVPFALGSIFFALFFTVFYVRDVFRMLYELLLEYSAIGIRPNIHWLQFDWFSLNLGSLQLIALLLFLITIFLLLMGGHMATRRFHVSCDMLYFVLLYGLIAPFWLVRSLYNLISAKEARWR